MCLAGVPAAIGRTQRQIDLIREHRIRLTADIVAGKLDARAVSLSDLDLLNSQEKNDD